MGEHRLCSVNNLAKYLANTSDDKQIPCFGVLGNLILSFSKLLNQKASHEPSGQYALNDEYYKRIEAIQFTMNHDDGNFVKEIKKSDVILLGVSRTSKTPTSIYLANKGFKTSNIPLINEVFSTTGDVFNLTNDINFEKLDYFGADNLEYSKENSFKRLARSIGDNLAIYPVKGYSVTVNHPGKNAPYTSLLDDN